MEKIAGDLLKDYQNGLFQQKREIINKLKSSERDLLAKIRQNPKLWNSGCLEIELNKSSIEVREIDPINHFTQQSFRDMSVSKYRPVAGNSVGLSASVWIKKPVTLKVTPKVTPQLSDWSVSK